MKEKKQDLCLQGLIILYGIILLIRAKYGFIWSDEGHYFAVSWRFVQGDLPLIHEWHVSQLHSILLIPYVKLMRLILGEGMQGFLLISRYLYTVLQTVMGLLIYRIFRKENRIAAFFSSIMFMLYCKSNVMTLSYYSIFTFCFTGAVVLQYSVIRDHDLTERQRMINMICSGLLWGPAIVCNPYALALFFLDLFTAWLLAGRRITLKQMILTTIAAAIPGICAVIFILSGAPLTTLLQSLPYIMSSDGGNYTQPFWNKLAWKLIHPFLLYRTTNTISLLLFAALLCIRKIKGKIPGPIRLISLVIISGLLMFNVFTRDQSVTMLTQPELLALSVWGLDLFAMSDKADHVKLIMLWLNGMIAAVFCGLSSDTGMNAMIQGYVVSSIGVTMILPEILGQITDGFGTYGKYILACVLVPYLITTGIMVRNRIVRIYRDMDFPYLTETIAEGPGAGIQTTEECVRRYDEICNTLQHLDSYDGDLYLSGLCPWGYLCTDMKVGNFTTWRITLDEQNHKGMDYLEMNPEKLPEIMIRLSGDNAEYGVNDLKYIKKGTIAEHAETLEQKMLEEDRENSLIGKLSSLHYRSVTTPCGELYYPDEPAYESIGSIDFAH
ncbi:MAG: hypothetical protein Q4D24_04285 [Erysipelotrichaceae bacterium]|nr:hypothetical protein [Erysipelotrichaceae bacterium]